MAKPIDKKNAKSQPSRTAAPARGRQEVATTPKREVASAENSGPPNDLLATMQQHAGLGVSTDASDNLIPIITILQDGSPQAKPRDPKYIEGAEASMIWLKNSDDPFVVGEEGILFQPCIFDKDFVEWVPRDSGGGFVTKHKTVPKEAVKREDPKNKNKVKWVMPNGNEIIETRYHIGRVFREDGSKPAYVIPLVSSGHQVSREWMFRMNNVFLPDGVTKAASFAKLYRLTTKLKTNPVGQSWFLFNVEDAGWIETREDYEAGLALYNAFSKGEVGVDNRTMDNATGGGDGEGGDGPM